MISAVTAELFIILVKEKLSQGTRTKVQLIALPEAVSLVMSFV